MNTRKRKFQSYFFKSCSRNNNRVVFIFKNNFLDIKVTIYLYYSQK